jgi:hypothetical protein
MSHLKELSNESRRAFLLKAFSSCTFCGMACSGLLGATCPSEAYKTRQDDKFLNPAGMSCQDVFSFAFRDTYIPVMKKLCEIIGKDEFLGLLRESSSTVNKAILGYWEANYPERNLRDWFTDLELSMNNDFFRNIVSYEVTSRTETSFELRFTECLWAKTFREAEAWEIGYSGICFADYALVTAFNPRLKFVRNKTLMEGADCCIFTYSTEG